MANTRISNLTASAANLASTDLAPVVQTVGVGPVKMTGLQLAGGLLGSATFNGATVTTSQPVLNLSQTWNAGAVTFTGLKFNVTNTSSAAASMLFDYQVGSATYLNATLGSTGLSLNFKAGASSFYVASFNTGGGASLSFNQRFCINDNQNFAVYNSGTIGWVSGSTAEGAAADLILRRADTATLQLGAADAAAPVAQTLQVQSVVAGTSNTAGTNFTINGSRGTGTGAGGSIIFQVAPAGSSGTSQNAYATALTIASDSNRTATFAGAMNVTSFSYWGGGTKAAINQNGTGDITTAATGEFSFGSSGVGSPDVKLFRDAANTLALRNSTNAQTFKVYNSFDGTVGGNNEYLTIAFQSNVAVIHSTRSGTGTARPLKLKGSNSTILSLNTDGTIDLDGRMTFATDNAYDIGATSSGRPRNVYVAGNIAAGGTVTSSLYFVAPAGSLNGNSGIYLGTVSGNRAELQATDVGVLTIGRWGAGDVRINFGGTDANYPALKRSSATLQVRLANDSANAALESASVKTDAPSGGTSGTWKLGVRVAATTTLDTTQYIEVDVGGTLYKLAVVTV